MALNKVTYIDGTTVIHSSNLNAIQDEIIANAANIATNTSNISTNTTNITELSGDVEDITQDITELTGAVADNTADIAANTAAIATKADQDTTYTKTEVDELVDDLETELEARGGFFIHDAIVQSGSTLQISCYNSDGTPMAENTRVNFRLNGSNYPLDVHDGKVSMQINLEANKDYSYIIYLNNSRTHKSGIINVW